MNELAGNKYTLDIKKEDLINLYAKEWVLQWCEKYHTEAFEKAKPFIEKHLNENL
ncbi:MAG: hypothetical protein GWP32_08820 [Bacteroidetes bacterium]|nr:hypothetical protein [Bacteroidota bacterium]